MRFQVENASEPDDRNAWVKLNQLPLAAEHDMQIVCIDHASSGDDFHLQAQIGNKFRFAIQDARPVDSTTVIQTGVVPRGRNVGFNWNKNLC